MPTLSSTWSHFFPPNPAFTERDLPDLQGKVYIVTGANTGIGKEVARFLYTKNAKVYVGARSEEKARKAIDDIQKAAPESTGSLIFLYIDQADLTTVKAAAQTFLAQEQTLHCLFNNAGVKVGDTRPPPTTVQGYELSIGVNCVAAFLFTKLLTPVLAATAASQPANTVRVVWLSSFAMEIHAQKAIGISTDNLDFHQPASADYRYSISKAGVWALGVEYARRHEADGIVSVPINPGNGKSELFRNSSAIIKLVAALLGTSPVKCAYTELYAAFSSDVAIGKADWSLSWVAPWGRVYPLREDLTRATVPEAEGGTGGTAKFWEWNEEQAKAYLAE
ncbi:hypothetical protein B0T24DRAFT_669084 [Lasiosphaeria ovina]|uniref:Short-chain dehydrogenase n=1 Tax=Lasiosphaeria ovina TaxID=92902 RepID=A0AAE0K5C9_9PEZI|nr:hypothetical protein B0T24DRAFT_669084 [Lasiosphaeria ovina]